MGLSYPLKLLKLTISFNDQSSQFEELFYRSVGVFHGAYIDIALNYVSNALN